MTLLVPNVGGVATFSIGSSGAAGAAAPLNMSLDDMIASRRKEKINETRRGGRARVSTVDRSIAAGRAKRNAAVNARRQITPTATKKPTQMEIEKEVKTQVDRTQRAQARQIPNKGGGRVAAAGGRKERTVIKAAAGARSGPGGPGRRGKRQNLLEVKTKTAAVQLAPTVANPPTKKAVNAAVQAFRANGFQIPQGTQMVIRFEEANKPASNAAAAGGPNSNAGGRGGGGRGRGGGAGRGGRGNNNNNNNPSNNRPRSNNPNNNRRGGRGGRNAGGN